MSYRHAKKLPKTSDTPDALTLTEAIRSPTDILGDMDGHNLDAVAVRTNGTPDSELWHGWHDCNTSVYSPNLEAGFGPSSVLGIPVSNSHEWETVTSATITTGQSVLSLFASCVGALTPWLPTVPTVSASAEVAISIDGVVIEISSTRLHEGSLYRNYCPCYPQASLTASIGPQVVRYSFAEAIGPAIWHARINSSFAVNPGTHVVSLLVRRVRSTSDMCHPDTTLRVYIPRLLALEIPTAPTATSTHQNISIPPYSTGDVISAASLTTSRLTPAKAAINDILTGDVRPGGLVHAHFPTGIKAASQTTILSGSSLPINVAIYPGFGSSTISPLAPPPATGWYLVNDGAGNNLSDTNTGAGWNTNGWGKVKILVLAHLQVTGVSHNAGLPGRHHIAAVTLMHKRADTGAWLQFGPPAVTGWTEAYCHSVNYSVAGVASPYGVTPRDERIEQTMSLVGWWRTGGNLAYDISEIGVYISTVDALGTGVGPAVEWDRGSIQVIVMRED
jgi:hypothetical protein